MSQLAVPNRPFSTDLITGLMLPDGIFEASLGGQRLNAQFQNGGASTLGAADAYVESVSHPAIVVTPQTLALPPLAAGATRVLSWNANFAGVPAGVHYVSFVAEANGNRTRFIKKIFVTRVTFNPTTMQFSAETPEGTLTVGFDDLVQPGNGCCGGKKGGNAIAVGGTKVEVSFLDFVREAFRGHELDFEFCPPGYLPHEFHAEVRPNPPFAGQYGDLPFQDPWWKIFLCLIALILLIAAAIVGAVTGGGKVTVTTSSGGSPSGSPTPSCCGVGASGGGSSYVVAGLVAAAAAAATAAALSDARDPFRRGQDATVPASGELTVAERLHVVLAYPEPVALGTPFVVDAAWEYERVTTGASYTASANDSTANVHVLSEYHITAPDVVRLYRREMFVVRGEFAGPAGERFKGGDIFVQCFLVGPKGQLRSFVMQDDGVAPDDKPLDGIFTGFHSFLFEEPDPRGIWTYFVIAQDINDAQPGMTPEEAAKIIGGMVLTHQLTLTFDGGTCPFVPDGHVHVV